jgi:hypothetical protein
MPHTFSKIIITSDEPYSDTWHTQLIYTEYLSSQTDVIFFNPPEKWSLSNLFDLRPDEKIIHDCLTLINYKNILPSSVSLFRRVNEWYSQILLRKKLKKENIKKILIWHFDSYRNTFNFRGFTNSFDIKRIYHVIDPFVHNPFDKLLSQLADLLVVTSPRIVDYYSAHSEKTLNIPQCIDLDLSKRLIQNDSVSRLRLPENFVVLLGTISDDIDYDWLWELTETSAIQLVIIGKTVTPLKNKSKFDHLLKKKNVLYLGEMPPVQFYPILKKATAGLVVYNDQRRKRSFSPLKAINYLVADIPVITNSDCEIPQLNELCIYNAETLSEFMTLVKNSIEKKIAFDESAASNYLQSISIKKAVETILSKI